MTENFNSLLDENLRLVYVDYFKDPARAALQLFNISEIHRYWSIADLNRLLLPPLEIGQCIFASRNRSVVGFCSWGLFSQTVSNGFANQSHLLQERDWNSGDILWLVDLIAPYGDIKVFARLLYDYLSELYPECKKSFAVRNYKSNHKCRRIASFSRRCSSITSANI